LADAGFHGFDELVCIAIERLDELDGAGAEASAYIPLCCDLVVIARACWLLVGFRGILLGGYSSGSEKVVVCEDKLSLALPG
jgi:hypothetical protein